ncbi:hypothetical protein [Pyxidicoccus sp. MSG2]|uniref:hypothetical protein n=1 Tax=Pyxidicoccus sp. MSG2 TaxID=2996790 RepID=UPI002270D931|nr:hypothetical protein [Pyxidicoccus sp. MSG2]MCY1021554.1 hypothetical protein [Pyxidicoccus sp. MSG2]
MRPLPNRLLPVLSLLLVVTGCSRGGGDGGLQKDVAMHCAELQRSTEQAAKLYRAGHNDLHPIGGVLSGHLISRLYNEANWCSRVRSEGQREMMMLAQELSIIASEVTELLPQATSGAGDARAEISKHLDRFAAIVGEINQRPLKR